MAWCKMIEGGAWVAVHEIQRNAALLRSAPAFAGAPVIRREGGLRGANGNRVRARLSGGQAAIGNRNNVQSKALARGVA
jgi:hypothetical protein